MLLVQLVELGCGLRIHRHGTAGPIDDPQTFVPGRGGDPARKRAGLTKVGEAFDQAQPQSLVHVVSVLAAQPVSRDDGTHQREEAFYELVPCVLVPLPRILHESGDGLWLIHPGPPPPAGLPASVELLGLTP
jgi:hypothetical protein